MPTEASGYELMFKISGFVAWIARMIGVKSVVFGGYDFSETTLKAYFFGVSRAPCAALCENSRSAATMATDCGFGFCAAAAWKKPSVKAGFAFGPAGIIAKYFG